MLRNLDIFKLETPSHTTRRVALANGGEAFPYSDLSVGRIEGFQRTIPALVSDGVADGDNWYVVNLIDASNGMSRYVQSVAVLGATSEDQARMWALKNIGLFVGANDAWNTAYTSTKVLKTYLNRPSTSVAMIAIRQSDLDTIAAQITDKPVVWDGSRLMSHDATSLLHELVKHDDEVMMMDAMTPSDLPILMLEMGGELAEYDALIVDYNRLDLLMNRLNTAMQKSSVGNVKPTNITQSKPFKKNGVTNVAALFEMNDGQSVTIVFHSPDNTPAKLAPSDTLTSWKWMLNKRDISAAVSPKNGENVQMPDLAKRILTIVEKNSARFIRANGNKAAQIQELTNTNTRIGQKQEALAGILAVNKDLQKQIDEAGKQISDANAPEIERIASLYAAALGQPVSKRSREFASDILSKNAYGLEFIANGMNDKGKKVFSEVTGVSLPKQQGATWKAIRDWAGISDEQEAYRVALRDVGYAVKSFMRENSVSQEMAEKNKALIASKIAEGFDSVQKIGKDYWLTNKEGQGINLSERPKKGYLGLSKSRALVEAMITESKAKKMLDSSVVQSPELPQQEPKAQEAEKPYSEQIIAALVANHGWTASTNSSATKEFTGMAAGGELSDGTRMLTARFDDKGRYIGIDKDGFDSTPIPETDMDMRDYMTDAKGGAKAFNDMVEAYVAKQRDALKPAPVAAPTPAAKSADLTGGRPDNWRSILPYARTVAKSLGIETKGKKLDSLVKEIDIFDDNEVKKELLAEFKGLASRLVLPKGYIFDLSDAEKSIGDITRSTAAWIRKQGKIDTNTIRVELRTIPDSSQGIIFNSVHIYTDDPKTKKVFDKFSYQRFGDIGASSPETPKEIIAKMELFLTKAILPEIEYQKMENSKTIELSELSELGIANIESIGNENIYIEKDGKYYISKVGNTEDYALGEWDFAKYPEGKPAAPAQPASEPPMTNPDRDYLQSIIDGKVDPLTVDMDAVIALAEKYDGDAEMTPLLDQALEVINQAEQEAAKGI